MSEDVRHVFARRVSDPLSTMPRAFWAAGAKYRDGLAMDAFRAGNVAAQTLHAREAKRLWDQAGGEQNYEDPQ